MVEDLQFVRTDASVLDELQEDAVLPGRGGQEAGPRQAGRHVQVARLLCHLRNKVYQQYEKRLAA